MDTLPSAEWSKVLSRLDVFRKIRKYTDSQYYEYRKQYLTELNHPGYRFDTDEDIIEMIDSLVADAKDVDIFPVLHVSDTKKMIKLGLQPVSADVSGPEAIDWLQGMDSLSLDFWYPVRQRYGPANLHEWMVWRYKTMETLKTEAIRTADSSSLLWQAPDLLYKGSKRPRTDMSMFRNALSNKVSKENVVDGRVTIGEETWQTIPVVRYTEGMSRGLFFGDEDTPQRFCGTFYYMEVESSTLLAFKNPLRAFNKTDACEKLGILDEWTIEYGLDNYDKLKDHIDGVYPRDMMMTPNQVGRSFGNMDTNSVPQTPHYAGGYLGLYAGEDSLDQLLCSGARDAGYDVVILENMIGKFQVVTEVLDTRSREHSFRSLVYVID